MSLIESLSQSERPSSAILAFDALGLIKSLHHEKNRYSSRFFFTFFTLAVDVPES